jgi:hypothetical protein
MKKLGNVFHAKLYNSTIKDTNNSEVDEILNNKLKKKTRIRLI